MEHLSYIFKNIPEDIEDSSAPWTDLVSEDLHVAIYRDQYPCTPGHLLFVPKYNTMAILLDAFDDALTHGQTMVESGEWDGFNIGMNYGSAAGHS